METLLSHCSASFAPHQNLLAGMFLAGLVGGFTHCMGMCGPFVLAQAMQPVPRGYGQALTLRRLSGWALLPYHLGRATTYATLGGAAALVSRQIIGTPWQQGMMAALLATAGVVFLMNTLGHKSLPLLAGGGWRGEPSTYAGASHSPTRFYQGSPTPALPRKQGREFSSLLARFAKPFFAAPDGWRGYVLGVMLGFLPCGLVYAALMMAATSGSPLAGAAGMALFALGTVPALVIAAAGGRALHRWKPQLIQPLGRGLMALSGLMLIILAGQSFT